MSNELSNELKNELFSQESGDPFLTLLTLTYGTTVIRLVNNTTDIISNANTYSAFPMKIALPPDDGEASRDFTINLDNVSLELIELLRAATDTIGVKIEMILASIPDVIQMSFSDLQIVTISYDKTRISAKIVLDNFLTVAMTSERYNPSNFPGLFQ